MTASRSDALVLFGVTGDLAHKMIFPALYAMTKRGALRVPVIGVASPPAPPLPSPLASSVLGRSSSATSESSTWLKSNRERKLLTSGF
jgi:glucose-6-phosphate 1-dehydrogenase